MDSDAIHSPDSEDTASSITIFRILFPCITGVIYCIICITIQHLGGMLSGFLVTAPILSVFDFAGLLLPYLLKRSFKVSNDLLSPFNSIVTVIPIVFLLNTGYLYIWSQWQRIGASLVKKMKLWKQIAVATAFAVMCWIVATTIICGLRELIISKISNNLEELFKSNVADRIYTNSDFHSRLKILFFATSLFSFVFIVFLFIKFTWKPLPSPRGHRRTGLGFVLLRTALVILSRGLGYYLHHLESLSSIVGICFAMPSVMTATMIAITLRSGGKMSAGVIGPLVLGMMSSSLFFIIGALLIYSIEWYIAIIISLVISAIFINIPGLFYLRNRRQLAVRMDQEAEKKMFRDVTLPEFDSHGIRQAASHAIAARGRGVAREV